MTLKKLIKQHIKLYEGVDHEQVSRVWVLEMLYCLLKEVEGKND